MIKEYVRIHLDGHGTYVQPKDDLMNAIDGELADLQEGEPVKLTFELVRMEESEYLALPEFAGH